jgi:RNA-directed DNA polymerase
MPEETPVNIGVLEWPHPDGAYFRVRKMQTKLYQWAKDDPSRRFDDLFNLVYDPAFLVHAWEQVSANAGARTAGIDRVTVAQIETWVGVEGYLQGVREQVKARTFHPDEVRQVKIPKANGKVRSLGIPTVTDRVVQAALKLVLEPIFEADFLPCSYGFRPNRRAQDAIAEIHFLTSGTRDYHWVLEADIAACFDEIDHVALLDRFRSRIKDKRVCALVKAFLKSGIMKSNGDREETLTGTPQGGILSPLLANIALSTLDEHFARQWEPSAKRRHTRKRKGLGNWRLIRYADDLVVLVSGEHRHAQSLRAEVAGVIAHLGLRLSPEKTRVVHIDQGFDFLGFHIRRRRKRGTNKHYTYTTPSKKAMQSILDRVRVETSRSTRHVTTGQKLARVERMVRGWANYFRHGVSRKVFEKLDHLVWWRLIHWIRRKHSRISVREALRRFATPGNIGHLTCNGATYRGASNVAITRYRYRGTQIPTPWTPKLTAQGNGRAESPVR